MLGELNSLLDLSDVQMRRNRASVGSEEEYVTKATSPPADPKITEAGTEPGSEAAAKKETAEGAPNPKPVEASAVPRMKNPSSGRGRRPPNQSRMPLATPRNGRLWRPPRIMKRWEPSRGGIP